jgi:hypothetical protein
MSAWISQQMAALDGLATEHEMLVLWTLGLMSGWVLGRLWEQRGRGHER